MTRYIPTSRLAGISGMAAIGGMIAGVEDRAVRIARYRADCGPYGKDIVGRLPRTPGCSTFVQAIAST